MKFTSMGVKEEVYIENAYPMVKYIYICNQQQHEPLLWQTSNLKKYRKKTITESTWKSRSWIGTKTGSQAAKQIQMYSKQLMFNKSARFVSTQ